MAYNGYKNYSTWNVSLWIYNDEYLYSSARKFMRTYTGKNPYSAFIRHMYMTKERTPDNIKWISTRLDYKALNAEMFELLPNDNNK